MSLRASVSAGTSESSSRSLRDTTRSTCAETVRVVCLSRYRRPSSSVFSPNQTSVASKRWSESGNRSGCTSRSPRAMSTSSWSRIETDAGAFAEASSPSKLSIAVTRERAPEGSTMSSSPTLTSPLATWPANAR